MFAALVWVVFLWWLLLFSPCGSASLLHSGHLVGCLRFGLGAMGLWFVYITFSSIYVISWSFALVPASHLPWQQLLSVLAVVTSWARPAWSPFVPARYLITCSSVASSLRSLLQFSSAAALFSLRWYYGLTWCLRSPSLHPVWVLLYDQSRMGPMSGL